jgi:hypothetical protein
MYPSTRVVLPDVQGLPNNILHFSLQSALPEGQALALNTDSGELSYLGCVDGQPRILLQEHLALAEMRVLLPLLEMYPYYCPYEMLYASFYRSDVSDKVVEICRNLLQETLDLGTWDQEMRPVRGALSRLRLKLRIFGIDVSSILATGYILMFSEAHP